MRGAPRRAPGVRGRGRGGARRRGGLAVATSRFHLRRSYLAFRCAARQRWPAAPRPRVRPRAPARAPCRRPPASLLGSRAAAPGAPALQRPVRMHACLQAVRWEPREAACHGAGAGRGRDQPLPCPPGVRGARAADRLARRLAAGRPGGPAVALRAAARAAGAGVLLGARLAVLGLGYGVRLCLPYPWLC